MRAQPDAPRFAPRRGRPPTSKLSMKTLPPSRATTATPARVATPFAASIAASFVALLLAGCATVVVPNEQMAAAEAAVQRANTPQTRRLAAVQWQLASDKLADARHAMGHKHYERARQLAEQAEVDARAAESHAQASRSRQAAQEAQEAARRLVDELARPTASSTPRLQP
jgi:hypothetical protein